MHDSHRLTTTCSSFNFTIGGYVNISQSQETKCPSATTQCWQLTLPPWHTPVWRTDTALYLCISITRQKCWKCSETVTQSVAVTHICTRKVYQPLFSLINLPKSGKCFFHFSSTRVLITCIYGHQFMTCQVIQYTVKNVLSSLSRFNQFHHTTTQSTLICLASSSNWLLYQIKVLIQHTINIRCVSKKRSISSLSGIYSAPLLGVAYCLA